MGRIRFMAALVLLFALPLCAGCTPAPLEEAPATPEPAPVMAPVMLPVEEGAGEEVALTEDERLAATRAVYDSYMALSAQTLTEEEQAAYRRLLFANMQQVEWFTVPYEDADDFWAYDFFSWLRDFPLDEEIELPYILLSYASGIDGALAESYDSTLARQFMAHPYALLRLVSAHDECQHFCTAISYGSYPRERELYSILMELQAYEMLLPEEQATAAFMLEWTIDFYDEYGWTEE